MTQLDVLEQLGFEILHPRECSLNYYQAKPVKYQPENIIIGADCLCVVPIYNDSTLDNNAKGILQGMLKVIKFNYERCMLVYLFANSKIANLNIQAIAKYNPKTVLIFDKELKLDADFFVVNTYGPEFLVDNSEYKKSAYQDLLDLEKHLRQEVWQK